MAPSENEFDTPRLNGHSTEIYKHIYQYLCSLMLVVLSLHTFPSSLEAYSSGKKVNFKR